MIRPSHTLLLVDDEKSILFSLRAALGREGYVVKTTEDPREAIKILEGGGVHVVISDYNMPEMNGLELLRRAKAIDPELVFIMMTAYGSEKLAIEAMKDGAYDYFSKPFEIDEMRLIVAKACERFNLAVAKQTLEQQLVEAGPTPQRLIGKAPPLELIRERIAQVARSDITVLIQGESGTGKEVVARELQAQSLRAKGPFVTLNCAALPENLIESELFGYERGAFTGAVGRRRGKFELASGGTLFLDEIGDMALPTQAKVLRAVQEGEIERLGGSQPIKVDVRLLAATHQDLRARIAAGQFREDLYYRINVVTLALPALRERRDDIAPLAEHFLREAAPRIGRTLAGFTPRALEALTRFAWPGNVRQLKNIVEGAAVFARGERIDLDHLPDELRLGFTSDATAADPVAWIAQEIEGGRGLDEVLGQLEAEVIKRTLTATGGNQSQTAQRLGLKRGTLQYKLKAHNLG